MKKLLGLALTLTTFACNSNPQPQVPVEASSTAVTPAARTETKAPSSEPSTLASTTASTAASNTASTTAPIPTASGIPENAECTFLGAKCAAGLRCETMAWKTRNAPGLCRPAIARKGAAEGEKCAGFGNLKCAEGLVCIVPEGFDVHGVCSK